MIYLLLFILGLFFGSFLNVIIDRIPQNETFIKGRSHCETCKKELQWYDLIPLISFFLLKGKCRYCKTNLSIYYPLIEFTTGALFALTYFVFGAQSFPFNLIYYLFLVSFFIVIFFTDFKYGLIPDKVVFVGLVGVLIYLLLFNLSSLLISLLAGIGALVFFLMLFLLTRGRGMGFGDVKLSFVLGLILGFPQIVLSLYIAFLTGAVVGLILILWGKKRFSNTIAFGPFLILGSLICLFWGNILLQKIMELLFAR